MNARRIGLIATIAMPCADNLAVPAGLPLTVKVTVPVGWPAPGGTTVTVAMSSWPLFLTEMLVAAFPTAMLSVPLAGEN